jgi:NitT/TauT family transport system permease protein
MSFRLHNLVVKSLPTSVAELLGNAEKAVLSSVGVVGVIAVWEIAGARHWVNRAFLPSPTDIFQAAVNLMHTGSLIDHIEISLLRVLIGFSAAVVVGVLLGFVLGGFFPAAGYTLRPVLKILGQVNAFSLFPVFILLFGIGEEAKIVIIFWTSLWPVLSMTLAGVRGVDHTLVRSVRAMSAGRFTIFWKVLIPASRRAVMSGIRSGLSTALLMLIAAEMLGATNGLGWLILNSQVNYQIPRMYAAAATIALLGVMANSALFRLERRITAADEVVQVQVLSNRGPQQGGPR